MEHNKMSKAKEVYRPTMDATELIELVTVLSEVKNTVGLPSSLTNLYDRLDDMGYKINKGKGKPAYVATGIRKQSPNSVSIDMLDATPKEKEFAHMTEDEQFAELERLNQEMLAGLVASGEAGSENVILEERRDSERLAAEAKRNEQSTDSDTMHNALMSML